MEKSNDVKIFMLCDHKVSFLVDNEIITPLECGADIKDDNVCEAKDNTEDNISSLNEFYLENTGVYWIWKNVHAKYKGQTQYRRQFKNLKYYDFDKIFADYDVIAAEPLDLEKCFNYKGCTVKFHYKVAHNLRDLEYMKEIIHDLYPEYDDSFVKYLEEGTTMLYSCGFIMKEAEYDKYCTQLFNVLEEFRKRLNLNTIKDVSDYVSECEERNEYPNWTLSADATDEWKHRYQMRIGGSLAERFFTLYVFHNFSKVFYLPYDVKAEIRI